MYVSPVLSFREYPALLAAWEQLHQKPDLVLSTAMGSRTRAVWVLPAILACWSTCRPSVSLKRLCGKFAPLDAAAGRWHRWRTTVSSSWCRRSKARCNPAVYFHWPPRWGRHCTRLGSTLYGRLPFAGTHSAGPIHHSRADRPSSAGCSSIQRCRNERFRVHCGAITRRVNNAT